jgi:hypothetical protein
MIGEELPVSFKVNKDKNAVSFEIPLDVYKQYFKNHVDNDFLCDTVSVCEEDGDYQGFIIWSESVKKD